MSLASTALCGASAAASCTSATLVAALVRPLVWLFIFAAAFVGSRHFHYPAIRDYILYEVLYRARLMAMIQLFNGMQSSLSMVYDREMGNMRTLLVSPLRDGISCSANFLREPRFSLLQVYAFLAIAWFWGYRAAAGRLSHRTARADPVRVDAGCARHADFPRYQTARELCRRDELCDFPMFFASSALYPLWRVQEKQPDALLRLPVQSIHPRG